MLVSNVALVAQEPQFKPTVLAQSVGEVDGAGQWRAMQAGSGPAGVKQTGFSAPVSPAGNAGATIGLSGGLDDAAEQPPYQLSGRFHLQAGTTQGYLVLECQLQPGSYIYSLTQSQPLKPTQISVTPSEQYALMGSFNPDQPAKVIEKDPVFEQRVEKHSGTVRFFVPFEIAPGVDANEVKPQLVIDGQVCSEDGFCMPINAQSVTADFAGYFERTGQR